MNGGEQVGYSFCGESSRLEPVLRQNCSEWLPRVGSPTAGHGHERGGQGFDPHGQFLNRSGIAWESSGAE